MDVGREITERVIEGFCDVKVSVIVLSDCTELGTFWVDVDLEL